MLTTVPPRPRSDRPAEPSSSRVHAPPPNPLDLRNSRMNAPVMSRNLRLTIHYLNLALDEARTSQMNRVEVSIATDISRIIGRAETVQSMLPILMAMHPEAEDVFEDEVQEF